MSNMIQRQARRAILLTPENEVLLMRIHEPGNEDVFWWIVPGGGIEPGESLEETLRRELREEVGLEDFEIGPLVWRRQHTFDWAGKRICQNEQYYIVHVSRFEPMMSDLAEAKVLDRFQWWPATELIHATEKLTPLSLPQIVAGYLDSGAPQELPELEILVD